jgi:hypothetical protein
MLEMNWEFWCDHNGEVIDKDNYFARNDHDLSTWMSELMLKMIREYGNVTYDELHEKNYNGVLLG